VHQKWDTNTAILTGDALSNLVYLLIAKSGFSSELLGRVVECAAEANLKLIDGELMDTEFETRTDVKEKDYFEMIDKKTGALINSAAQIGALLGTRSQTLQHAVDIYGDRIGTAFQIKDDLLDLTGDEEETGKDFAGDIKEGKKTVLLLHALENASPGKSRKLAKITSSSSVSRKDIFEAIDIMQQAGSFDYAESILSRLIAEAKQSLLVLPNSEYVNALSELADFIGESEKVKVEYPLYRCIRYSCLQFPESGQVSLM
jgi:geranylgeranyl diphosphate synthase type I